MSNYGTPMSVNDGQGFVPAGAFGLAGATQVYKGLMPALDSTVPYVPEGHPGFCEAKTKAGEACQSRKAHETNLCVGHLQAVAAWERAVKEAEGS